jgi:hypothetical protein
MLCSSWFVEMHLRREIPQGAIGPFLGQGDSHTVEKQQDVTIKSTLATEV